MISLFENIIVIVFFCLIFYRFKFYGKNVIYDDYLSVQNCGTVKGICAIGILLHHLSQHCAGEGGKLFTLIFPRIGCLLVAVFFFLSAYGIMCQRHSKGDYMNTFLYGRFIKLLLPYVGMAVCAYLICLGFKRTELLWFFRLTDGGNGVLGQWFILVLFLQYVFIYIAAKKNNNNYSLGWTVLFADVIYIIILNGFGWYGWWYNAVLAFPAGIFYWILKKKFENSCADIWKYFAILTLMGLGYVGMRLFVLSSNRVLAVLGEVTAPVFFMFFCIIGYMRIKISYKIWYKLGNISYEIFILQFVYLEVLRNPIQNDIAYIMLVGGLTILTAWGINTGSCLLINILKNKLRIARI